MAKNKIKTHKASAKKFKVRNSGSVTFKRAGANHLTTGYSSKRMRHLREAGQLSGSDSKRLKRIIDTLK
ncbi:MAG: 50S ribosomal protein L35 [Bacilli bacterium]|nr:50S ribosomal protein L35 [Bacilli bacterium]